MFSLNADRFWTIMFTIPLPLVLSSVAVGQTKMVDPEPIRIVRQTTIDPTIVKVESSNFHQPKCRVDQGAQCWIHQAVRESQSSLRNTVDPLRLIHPTTMPKAVAPMKIGVAHIRCAAPVDTATPECVDARRRNCIDFVKPPQWVAGRYSVTRIRSEKFVSFDSQAPPRDSPAIACAAASKYFVPVSFSEFLHGAQAPSEPPVSISNPIRRNYRVTFAHSTFIPPNSIRRPRRYRIQPLVLTQSA
jgi:hypothetical protein